MGPARKPKGCPQHLTAPPGCPPPPADAAWLLVPPGEVTSLVPPPAPGELWWAQTSWQTLPKSAPHGAEVSGGGSSEHTEESRGSLEESRGSPAPSASSRGPGGPGEEPWGQLLVPPCHLSRATCPRSLGNGGSKKPVRSSPFLRKGSVCWARDKCRRRGGSYRRLQAERSRREGGREPLSFPGKGAAPQGTIPERGPHEQEPTERVGG